MVTRKSSIPVPNAPPPPPPPDFTGPNHDLDTSDIPPIPERRRPVVEDSPYDDMGNPWADSNSAVGADRVRHPSILRPGASKPQLAVNATDVPDVMQPGWSGQNTPRSSLDSKSSKDFWEDSDDEEHEKTKPKTKAEKGKTAQVSQPPSNDSTDDLIIPSPLQIRRKPIGTSPLQQSKPTPIATPPEPDFASNNPFRKNSSPNPHPPAASWAADVKGKGKAMEPYPTTQLNDFTANKPKFPDYSAFPAQPQNESAEWQKQRQEQQVPQPQSPPPPIPIQITSPLSEQPSLIPVSPRSEDHINPWGSQQSLSAIPSPMPFTPSQQQNTYSTDDLLDRGQQSTGRISLGDELKALPNATWNSTSETSLLDDQLPPVKPPRPVPSQSYADFAPPPGPPPSHIAALGRQSISPPPPTKPPRPAVVVKPPSNAEIAQIQEQRNETYQIKHFNWFDHRTGKLRTSSMLTQNKNGPCPLLALVNALILGVKDESQAALDDALRSREQVTLGLIIETLMDELLSSGVHLDGDLPDVDELNKFLLKLRTGMNMNPRFVQPRNPPPNLMDARNSVLSIPTSQSQDQPGTFESTQDVRLYGAFGIRTVHGWLPDPGSEVIGAFGRSAESYEDAQVVQFGEEELDYKLTHGGLTSQEQQLSQDIVSIKGFFGQHPTQLTPYGLSCIRQSMESGSFAILFRNDHFSTIYKHPRDGKLYTLITDAGYADRDEVIWESLVDISGQQSEFFSGDFQSVSHHVAGSSRRSSNRLSTGSVVPEPLSPQQQQEQHDADYAMALQLQEEEEQRMRNERNNRPNSGSGPTARGGGNARRGQGIPIPLRGSNPSSENRPLIPPRNLRSNAPAVNRPSDTLDADAPPTYEEAARGKPYNPPLGSPLHPESSPSADHTPAQSSSHVNLPDVVGVATSDNPSSSQRLQRRHSAYTENHEQYGHSSPRSSSGRFEFGMSPAYEDRNSRIPGSFSNARQAGYGQDVHRGSGVQSNAGRRRNEDGDCLVM